jgi:glutathione S-transferase
MKLYVTFTSPFARLARVVILEKQLQDKIEVIGAKTRTRESAYYEICPSGRVPFLLCDDGRGLEDSVLICSYLDHLDGAPLFHPDDLEHERLAALARSLVDNYAVWGRELYRPADERSPGILAHEQARAVRLSAQWEQEVLNPVMQGPLNMAQITLFSGLQQERRNPAVDWRGGHPNLLAWHNRLQSRPSFAATEPAVEQLK